MASVRRVAGDQDLEIVVVPASYGSSIWELRGRGVEQASCDRIAILDDRYEVTAAWWTELRQPAEFDALGGCVAPSPQLGYWAWCVYFSEYSHLAPPIATGKADAPKSIPGGNVVYPSSVRDRVKLEGCQTELDFHRLLADSGANLRVSNSMLVWFASPPSLPEYVAERYRFSCAIAGSRGERWRILLTPFLPPLVLLRTFVNVFKKKNNRLRWLACAPIIFALGFVQAAGEVAGCWHLPGAER